MNNEDKMINDFGNEIIKFYGWEIEIFGDKCRVWTDDNYKDFDTLLEAEKYIEKYSF